MRKPWVIGLVVQQRNNVRVAPGFYGWLALLTSLASISTVRVPPNTH